MARPLLTYISSRGTVFNLHDFQSAKLYEANFHKVEWIPETIKHQFGTTIMRFTKDALIFDVSFRFKGSYDQRKQQIDDLMFAAEYDVSHQKLGRICWNDEYIQVYFNVSDTHPTDEGYTEIEGEFYAPYPFWIEEQRVQIRPSEEYEGGYPENVKGYDPSYPYEYAYPYAKTSTIITVDSALDSNFRATIYGPTNDVTFSINSHVYKINHALRTGQIMVLDTRQNIPLTDKIYIINEDGTRKNVFDYRDPDSDVFAKIPNGSVIINYTRTYGIDFDIYQERSAPK